MTAAKYDVSSPALSADAVRAARFATKRHGWDEKEVRTFLEAVANDIQTADAERASLRAELHDLRAEVEGLRGSVNDDKSQTQIEISVHAVQLLSQAQQTADSCVAEAEQYARDLVGAARNQYQDILANAQHAAERSMAELAAVPAPPSSSASDSASASASASDEGGAVSVPEIEYVRTFARVAQVQLRSVLDALAQEVDKLGQLPRLEDVRHPSGQRGEARPPSGPVPVSWEPNNLLTLNVTRADAS